MTIWAIGSLNQPARCYVEATSAMAVMEQMEPNEEVAPVSVEQKMAGVVLKGNMTVELVEPTNG